MPRILLVDDDPHALESTRKILELSGYSVTPAVDGQAALELVRPTAGGRAPAERFDAILTDVRMPRLGGLEFLRALSLTASGTPVILMTAFGRVEDAVWAMKLGAVDFLTKPFKRQTLVSAIELALKRSRASTSGARSDSAGESSSLVGRSAAMVQLRAQISQIARTAATVLLHGESGTGKELVARRLHEESPRDRKPFVAINCAAVPEQLIESELFGSEKGAYTGATSAREGLFAAADGGTLLLDEIGDMPLGLQAKLLRVLQEGEVRPIGATQPRKVDVRVIAATHRDLRTSVERGTFRQDLLFRLEVIGLRIPPLRERGASDIRELAYHFLQFSCRRHGREINALSESALGLLEAHAWPGNVRELQNVIERAVIFAQADTVEPTDFPEHFRPTGAAVRATAASQAMIEVAIGTPLREVEELLIRKTLEATAGDKGTAARLLGINQRTIYRKLEKEGEFEA